MSAGGSPRLLSLGRDLYTSQSLIVYRIATVYRVLYRLVTLFHLCLFMPCYVCMCTVQFDRRRAAMDSDSDEDYESLLG